jgi:aspartate aminotransferase
MIPASIDGLLRPLEEFEALRRKAARLGKGLCDLSYANPYDGAQQQAILALQEALEERRLLDLQYTPFGGRTIARRHVADALRKSHALPFTSRDIILTPGAMSALQIALNATVKAPQEVVTPVPCWLDYPVYVQHVGATPVLVPPSPTATLDVSAIASAITEKTRAVLLSHPSNPTGENCDSETLAALAAAITEREAALGISVTIIADETHRDFTAAGSYDSLARHFPRTLIVYSFGKYHFLQGQRLGYLAVSPDHPRRAELALELQRWTRIAGFATPTALMQQAIPRLLALSYDHTWLDEWRATVAGRLRQAGYRVVPSNATLFVYVGTPKGSSDWKFAAELAARGVLVLPAPVFHHTGHFRLALTGSKDMLARALDVLDDLGAACAA